MAESQAGQSHAKTYEPVGGQDDLVIEAFIRAGEGFSVGSEDNSWPYTTEDTGEQAFLDAHSLVKEQGTEDPSEATRPQAPQEQSWGEADAEAQAQANAEASAPKQPEEAGEASHPESAAGEPEGSES